MQDPGQLPTYAGPTTSPRHPYLTVPRRQNAVCVRQRCTQCRLWVDTSSITVAPGQIAGVRQVAQGWLHGRDAITLTWQTAVGIPDTHDVIRVDGTPPIDLVIRNGLHDDQAAAALILHAIPRVLAAPPGLTTVLELPPLHYQPRPEPDAAWSPHALNGIPGPD